MAKIIDYFSLCIIFALVTFVWSVYLFDSFVGALIFSVALSLAATFTIHYVAKRKQKPYTYDRLALEFSIKGGEYVVNIFKSILKNHQIESGSNYILLENCIIIVAFKFSMLTIADMSAICSLATKHARSRVFVIARGIDRRAYQAIQLENISLNVIKIKPVFKFLAKHDALPNLKPIKHKFSLRALVDTILSRNNLKSYLFSGATLIAVSFLTPLKIYYIVFGTIMLALALLTLTPLGNGTFSSPKVFDELEQLIKSEQSNQTDDN